MLITVSIIQISVLLENKNDWHVERRKNRVRIWVSESGWESENKKKRQEGDKETVH